MHCCQSLELAAVYCNEGFCEQVKTLAELDELTTDAADCFAWS
ncbi:hypothetical protein PAMC26510_03100 [Caballeronia sordidicola]|uniref:Uncharacterized protein n=1 Tax=Caballeronia sordidicola TaxID=196367 RepID=A0A2C9XVK7_CABSO|nr:hypothetical protein PAMC26510_03100 [Caballeronia sordidicola]